MNFDFPGYQPIFIQKDRCADRSAHLFSYVYKFYSPITKYHYIVRIDEHQHDFFAIKFYCKKDRKSDKKYNKIINKGDLGNICITCMNLIPVILRAHPTASFGFAGARTVDSQTGKTESIDQTQRFKVYKYIISKRFGNITFSHYEYPENSSYLLLNNSVSAREERRLAIEKMMVETYADLHAL